MGEEVEPKKKQRRSFTPFVLGAMTLILFAGLVVLQVSAFRFIPPNATSYNLIAFALVSFNFIAFAIFAFIFLRNFIKLRREYGEKQIGSKIRTQFLTYFIVVSFLPICAMAVFSFLFVNRSIDKWFSPLEIINEAQKVQERANKEQTANTEITAKAIAWLLEQQTDSINAENLTRVAQQSGLAHISVVFSDGNVVSSNETNEEIKRIVETARTNNTDATLADNQGFDEATAQMSEGRMTIIIPQRRNEANSSEIISNAPNRFEDLKQSQRQVRALGISTLGLLTFLMLFATSWVAIYLARGIATPIKALAEASNEIAKGNFAHRVETVAENELAMLVASFNQMTSQLEENRRVLESNAKELRDKNAAIEDRRNYIETVLKSVSTGVVSLDENDCVTAINAAAVAILRIEDAHSGEKCKLASIINGEDLLILERLLRRARRMGRANEQTELGRNSDNNHALPVALTATALRSHEGKESGVVVVIEDLSELLTAQRAAAWSEVARRMAHEIKNPLTPIQLSAERIAKNFKKNADCGMRNADLENSDRQTESIRNPQSAIRILESVIDECTATITREVAGLKAMVDEFSNFARLPNAKLEPADLNEVIHQSVALYEDRLKDVKIDIRLGDGLPQTMLDAEQLRRAFVNLIDNSLEALDQIESDKRITIATAHDPRREILLAEITDNGHGIAHEDFRKLFQPYFSTKGRGTGLGLAIVQRIIIEHGGKIKAESNHPRGAKFVIELPVAQM
jgi:nitrogen fixation/metabolism regulation signal transduction histidine kinase